MIQILVRMLVHYPAKSHMSVPVQRCTMMHKQVTSALASSQPASNDQLHPPCYYWAQEDLTLTCFDKDQWSWCHLQPRQIDTTSSLPSWEAVRQFLALLHTTTLADFGRKKNLGHHSIHLLPLFCDFQQLIPLLSLKVLGQYLLLLKRYDPRKRACWKIIVRESTLLLIRTTPTYPTLQAHTAYWYTVQDCIR